MAKHAEFRIESEITEKEFLKFQEDFKKEIIQNGFTDVLTKAVPALQSSLKVLINEQIRLNGGGALPDTTPAVNGLMQPGVNPPKSESEILSYLTGGKTDVSKYNKAKDYTTLQETGIVFGQRQKGSDKANRIALRMDIDDSDTVQSQYAKASRFFQEAIFALPDAGGTIRYYANPGLDITGYVKIKCSTLTGAGDAEPFEGMSPAQRFQRNRHTKGYADWTLKQNGIDFIRKNFVDLTEVISQIKDGDYSTARTLLNKLDKGNKLGAIKTAASNLDVKTAQPSSMQSYTTAIQLINNMQLTKKTDDISTTYSLVSSYDDFPAGEVNFFENLMRNIRAWIVANEDVWFQLLADKVEQLIKRFESGK